MVSNPVWRGLKVRLLPVAYVLSALGLLLLASELAVPKYVRPPHPWAGLGLASIVRPTGPR